VVVMSVDGAVRTLFSVRMPGHGRRE